MISTGWTITYNKYAGTSDTLPTRFYVMHGNDTVHFLHTNATVESGQPNQEIFDNESEAIAKVLELDKDYFPEWDRTKLYTAGDRIKFGNCIYRALQDNESKDFTVPSIHALDPEVPTPMNRQARWQMVCSPEFE